MHCFLLPLAEVVYSFIVTFEIAAGYLFHHLAYSGIYMVSLTIRVRPTHTVIEPNSSFNLSPFVMFTTELYVIYVHVTQSGTRCIVTIVLD